MSESKSPDRRNSIFVTPTRKISQSNRKILSESINNIKNVPEALMRSYEKSQDKKYSLTDKLKNLQDPLRFNQSQKIKTMINDTEEACQSFRNHIHEVTELSKVAYKQIIARQTSEFNVDRFKNNFFNSHQTRKQQNSTPKSKWKQEIQISQNNENQKYSSVHPKLNQMHVKYMKNPVQLRKMQLKCSGSTRKMSQKGESQVHEKSLTWAQIKLIDTQQFDIKCRDFEFFDLLRSDRNQRPIIKGDFNLYQSYPVQRLMKNLQIGLIDKKCYEYDQFSTVLRFNFEGNSRFYRQEKFINESFYGHKKLPDEEVLAVFDEINLKKIPTNIIYDIGMEKITPNMIEQYINLKKQHRKNTIEIEQANENLQKMYQQLLQKFEIAKMVYKDQKLVGSKKYVHSEANTIGDLRNKDFDTYFREDVHLILKKIIKLDDLRQKVLKSRKQKPQLVLIKNICLQIKEALVQLLMTMLKGQNFYDQADKKAPFFTYADLVKVEDRQELERKVLEVIYSRINGLTVEEVDGVAKTDIIKIYMEERQKNNKILRILGAV